MKNFISMLLFMATLTSGSIVYASGGKSVSEKVIQSFKETFPFAQKVDWQEVGDRYIVHFEDKNIKTVVNYDKEGNYVDSKRYYSEGNLPVNIICKLRKKYADKKIFGVTEMSNEYITEYYIKMEDSKNWITVKSDVNGSMEVVEKYQKQL